MEYVKPITFEQLRHMRDELHRIQCGLNLWVEDLMTDAVDDLLEEESAQEKEEEESEQEEEEEESEQEESEQKSESSDVEYVKTSTTSNKRVAVGSHQTVKEKVRRWILAARPDAQPSIVVAEATSTEPFVAVEPSPPAPPVPAPLDAPQAAPDRNCFDFMRELHEFCLNNLQEEPALAVMEPEPISYSPLPASSPPSEVGQSILVISSDGENWEQDIDANDLLAL